jgi:carbonic anhydrase/acetyltransferase-like protein (isoleucine patch superfamily)
MPIYALDGVMPKIADGCWVAPDAVLIGKVQLMKGASVWFGAVLRGDNDGIIVGEDSNVQDHSIIHADPGLPVTIGRGVTIGHRVIVHSASIGENCLIGMGAILLNGARVGNNCLVGAGALLTEGKAYEDGRLILGSPARAMRDLTPEQVAGIGTSAEIYVKNARRYAERLTPV